MAEIKDLLFYLVSKYPKSGDLSKTKVTKLVYLCDWKAAIEYQKQLTHIEWYYDNFGPFVWDVVETAKDNPELFEINSAVNFFGDDKLLVSLNPQGKYEPYLEADEKKIADFVIKATSSLPWNQFIKLVYSTYPIVTTPKYSKLDLLRAAEEYKKSLIFKDIKPEVAFQ